MGREFILEAEPGIIDLTSAKVKRLSRPTEVRMDCGKCGSDHFLVVVTPMQDTAKVAGVVCVQCKNCITVGEDGMLNSTGKTTHHFKNKTH